MNHAAAVAALAASDFDEVREYVTETLGHDHATYLYVSEQDDVKRLLAAYKVAFSADYELARDVEGGDDAAGQRAVSRAVTRLRGALEERCEAHAEAFTPHTE